MLSTITSTATVRAAWRPFSTTALVGAASSSSRDPAAFWTSDERLIKAIRRRQETYRLSQVGNSARKKSDRIEAAQLANAEVRWLVQHVRKLQTDTAASKSSSRQNLDRASRRKLVAMATQMTRASVPLSYLLGSVPFGSLPVELTVRPPILLPRPETEHWATQVVADLLRAIEASSTAGSSALTPIRIADLCTGSGCVALLIAHALRSKLGDDADWRVVACDRSPLAVQLARENATKLGFSERNVRIVEADVFSDADMDGLASIAGGAFDVVLSNPPYIPRREWQTLSAEVKAHEDPAALIGERDVSPATSDRVTGQDPVQDGQGDAQRSFINRTGLAFHQRLAELLYRPSFAARDSQLRAHGAPRLVAEYGKGQQRLVAKLHADLVAPADRMPRVVRLSGHQLVVVGVGNATTHPLTRHSIGQVVLDPLLARLVAHDAQIRRHLAQARERLEQERTEALASGRIDPHARPDWAQPVPARLPLSCASTEGQYLDPNDSVAMPSELTKVRAGKSGGWAATIPLLVRASDCSSDVYQVEVSLYKPSQAMNLSGVGLRAFLTAHHPNPTDAAVVDDTLVLQDDLDVDFGLVKAKSTGSATGHNGVRDILARLNVADTRLARLRIGIGRPPAPTKEAQNEWLPRVRAAKAVPVDKWVLSKLTKDELASCTAQDGEVVGQVEKATLEWIRQRCSELGVEDASEQRLAMRKDQFGIHRSVWIY
ncbi:predicted methyltransferase [Moesziomyces antarcticus T-34]|uniref:Predicted methyltransferase n=1 Tax=Pseudozyma antarctica (strain T-34) TaxID=1151754 RepID=M9LJU0_PSEA3|nr:predicted methyltransferase [Moesziomyces antarcticus T-34]